MRSFSFKFNDRWWDVTVDAEGWVSYGEDVLGQLLPPGIYPLTNEDDVQVGTFEVDAKGQLGQAKFDDQEEADGDEDANDGYLDFVAIMAAFGGEVFIIDLGAPPAPPSPAQEIEELLCSEERVINILAGQPCRHCRERHEFSTISWEPRCDVIKKLMADIDHLRRSTLLVELQRLSADQQTDWEANGYVTVEQVADHLARFMAILAWHPPIDVEHISLGHTIIPPDTNPHPEPEPS